MKKIISFSLFVSIVIHALAARSSASAQSTRPVTSESAVVVRVSCPRTSTRWGKAVPIYRPRHFRRYAVRWHARPVRRGRYS